LEVHNPVNSDKKKVMVIDDDRMMRITIADYLEDEGFSVIQACNGVDGIKMFREEYPDIVLVDFHMPEMDGPGVIMSIRNESPDTPIIIVSGTRDVDDIINTHRLGAWDYITKPIYNMKILEIVINRAFERERLLAENRIYRKNLESLVYLRAEEIHNEDRQLYRVVTNMAEVVIEVNLDQKIEWANRAALLFSPDAKKSKVKDFFSRTDSFDEELFKRCVEDDTVQVGRNRSGKIEDDWGCIAVPLKDNNGVITSVLMIFNRTMIV